MLTESEIGLLRQSMQEIAAKIETKRPATHHVIPSAGGWKVTRESGASDTTVHATQADAIAAASARARARGLGSIIVHRPDGRIVEKDTGIGWKAKG